MRKDPHPKPSQGFESRSMTIVPLGDRPLPRKTIGGRSRAVRQLTGWRLILVIVALVGVTVISVLLGLRTKRSSDEGFRKLAGVEQKRIRLGKQAEELRKALDEQHSSKDKSSPNDHNLSSPKS